MPARPLPRLVIFVACLACLAPARAAPDERCGRAALAKTWQEDGKLFAEFELLAAQGGVAAEFTGRMRRGRFYADDLPAQVRTLFRTPNGTWEPLQAQPGASAISPERLKTAPGAKASVAVPLPDRELAEQAAAWRIDFVGTDARACFEGRPIEPVRAPAPITDFRLLPDAP